MDDVEPVEDMDEPSSITVKKQNDADDGSDDDSDGVDDIDGAAAGPSKAVRVEGAAAGLSNVVTETPLHESTGYVDMSTSQCNSDCFFLSRRTRSPM